MNYILNEDVAEETGIHVGDGSMNIYASSGNGACYTLACHERDDREYIDSFVLPLIKKIYGKTPKPRNWSEGTYGFRFCSKEIILFKHNILGLPLGRKDNISVPKQILSNKQLMFAFLRGLFDTDGCVPLWRTNGALYPRIQFVSISRRLTDQVAEFLRSEGFRVTFWVHTTPKKNWKEAYCLSINGRSMAERWMKLIGFHNPKHLKKIALFGLKKETFIRPSRVVKKRYASVA
ncbi:hypothetical protein GOV07_04640 [Candidatus Woesearchaeota archaeon]|nr:hypothetical protein [Candidatus Woesearchaeota archaeon]